MSYKNLKFEYLFRLMNIINGSTTKDLSFIYNAYKRSSENFDGSMKMLLALGFIEMVDDRIEILNDPFDGVDNEIINSRENFRVLILNRLLMNEAIKDELKQYLTRFSVNDSYVLACKLNKENSLNNVNLRNFLMTLDLIEFDKINELYFINNKYFQLIKPLLSPRNFHLKQLEKIMVSNQEIGDLAEDAVVKYEVNRLDKDFPFPERLVEKISVDQVNAGYDIESHLVSNDQLISIKIEVKAVSLKDYRFFWSKNEMKAAKMYGDRYYLYLVPCIGNNELDMDNIKIIKNPHKHIIENDAWFCEVESASFHWTNK